MNVSSASAGVDSQWDYKTFGEGPCSRSDHVIVSTEFYDKTGPMTVEEQRLLQWDDDVQKRRAEDAPGTAVHVGAMLPLEEATLRRWGDAYEEAMRALGDEEKEADMVRINARLEELIGQAGAPPYKETQMEAEGGSELDYFTELLYRARLAPHRDELLHVLGEWLDGHVPLSKPLELVERLIDENVLQPDVLLVAPGDYHYHYNDDESYGE